MTEKNLDHTTMVDAAIIASDHLTTVEVPHCLVGRLALASHGFAEGNKPRDIGNGSLASPVRLHIKDIEILVDAGSAFSNGGNGMVLTKVPLPLSVSSTKIRWCTLEEAWERKLWSSELVLPEKEGSIPIAPLPVVLAIMMLAGDEVAVEAALLNGASAVAAQAILSKHNPRLGARLSTMIEATRG